MHVDTGLLAVTDKHIYFHGSRKAFRVRFDKIVSFDQFSDGFGIMRDAQTAKPQPFRTGNGWFGYNLATNFGESLSEGGWIVFVEDPRLRKAFT